jgi:4-hydroxy-tetrahydrodipicolinate reductase
MGAALVTLAGGEAGFTVAAAIEPPGTAEAVTLATLTAADIDVLVDFSHRESVSAHAAWTGQHGVAWVLGTTGLSPDDQAAVQEAARLTLVFQASNFSLGVALLTDLAARAARVLGLRADIEIIETHHHDKRDAPSGTALSVGRAIAQARGQDFDVVRCDGRSGLPGPRPIGEIGLHAVRMGDVVGEHEVVMAWPDERLRISHEARDRRVFAHGALRAARFCSDLRRGGRTTGLLGMPDLLADTAAPELQDQ